MTPLRRPDRITDEPVATAFYGVEEAWFWFARCQRLRREGARFSGSVRRFERPCDPDDIYKAAMGLYRSGTLKRGHLQVLARFGVLDRPPDPRRGEELAAARLWDEALDRLTLPLRAKGIVA